MSSKAQFELKIPTCTQETLVVDFHAHEEISDLFTVNLTLACKNKVPFSEVLGKIAVLKIISNDNEPPRYFHGVICKFQRAGQQGKFLYEATILPYLSLLTMSTDCRIFQNKTVVEIVKEVLKPYKKYIGTDRYEFKALKGNGDKVKRVYCVQYRETDLDFICRILADEGIFFYFEHFEDKHVIIFGDNIMNYKEISGTSTIAFQSSSGTNTGTDCVHSFDFSQQLTPGKVTHSSYNFENSSVKLMADKTDESIFNLEIYDHSAHLQDEKDGKKHSKTHLESLKTFQGQAEAQSICPRLSAGYIFSMDKAPKVQYLVTSITHLAMQPQVLGNKAGGGKTTYSNIFTSIPAKTIYRPHMHPKPVVTGLQSAVVVGPKGEEIHTDEHGRVRVQFHWDRKGKKDENSSCMLRVVQSWGGGGFGAQFIPRIGDEVIVDFLEGDPDHPIVTGCVYNGDNQPINSLQKSVTQSGFKTKTHKGGGGHELRFDDKDGSQEIFLHSQKDWNVNVNNRKGQTIGGDSSTVIGQNSEQSIGANSYTFVTGKQTEHAKEIVIAADTTITIVCGASSIVISPAGIKINGPKVNINDGSSVPMPAKQPVAGSTGSSSGGGGGGGSGSGSGSAGGGAGKPDVTKQETKTEPKKTEPAQETAPSGDNAELGGFKGDKPISGGFASMPGTNSIPASTGSGNLMSSASSAMSSVSGLKSKLSPDALKNAAMSEVKGKVTQELGKAKAAVLEKSGIASVQNKATQVSDKAKGAVSDGIKTSDVIKTM